MKNPDTNQKLTDQEEEDAKLAQKAKDALKQNRELVEYDIEVGGYRGHISLHGTVSMFSHKDMAEKLVADIPGVTEVDNHLSVGMPSDDDSPSRGLPSAPQAARPPRDIAPGGAGSGTPCVRPT